MEYTIIDKMTVVCNINSMRNIIGLESSNVDFLLSKTYEDLQEIQNNLIAHYNEACANKL